MDLVLTHTCPFNYRPTEAFFNIETYEEVEMFGAKVYFEKEFDNLVFAKDGEIYNFN